MVRYFLTDLRGNPIYSFAQRRLRRNNNLRLVNQHHARDLSQQLAQIEERQQQSNFVTTTLVCMVRNRAWEDVLKRVATHPTEVHAMDAATGNTVLHAACRLNPPAAVVKALAATPTLARQPNLQGATPLHVAASHRCSAEALQALLDACRVTAASRRGSRSEEDVGDKDVDQDAAIAAAAAAADQHTSPTADLSRMGRAPIHYACMSYRGLEIDAFCLLLDATLQEGNVWVYQSPPPDDDTDLHLSISEVYSSAGQQPGCGLMVNKEEGSDDLEEEEDEAMAMIPTSFDANLRT